MVDLTATASTVYDRSYHHKLRGRFWQQLRDTEFSRRHDKHAPPGFCFSNPFPPQEVIEEGEEMRILISSVDMDLIAQIGADLMENPELNVGEMPFEVDSVYEVDHEVGEPGTKGTIETGTGIFVSIPPDQCETYGIEQPETDTDTFWRPEHTIEPFKDAIEQSLQFNHELYGNSSIPGPAEVDWELFNGYDYEDSYSFPLQVSPDTELTVIVTEWEFDYRVQNDYHRQHLNLALDVGLGKRTGMGLGFLNIADKQHPADQQTR
jgi:CRISPR-associated endoribonuclease Cas6